MVKSMTGFGRGENAAGEMGFTVELKSINNRYKDIVIRIPKELQPLEELVRVQVGSKIRRGRVEVFIQMRRNEDVNEYELELNLPLVSSYVRIMKQINEEFGLEPNIRAEALCQMKDVIQVVPRELDLDEAKSSIITPLTGALQELDEMRVREGKAIEEDFHKRLQLIVRHLDDIATRAPIVVESYKTRLKEKIQKISGETEIDESRILQEVAIFSDRCDITEEIVRIRSHIEQFRHTMTLDDTIGRRLDFLVQEINREANTIGAKSNDGDIAARVIEIKAELEKMREQIQNVE